MMEPRVLVGRERELGLVDDVVRAVTIGERQLVFVSGEPGIGKTRILEELARRVAAVGGVAAWGRMWEVGMTPAFWPWIQILATLESGDDRAPQLGSGDARADSGNRLGKFAEVVDYLARRAAVRPVALVFDDLHVIDPSSLQLLDYVLPLLAGHRVVVAIAARDGDAAPELATAIGRLLRGARRMPLARLAREDVATLVRGRADGDRVFELSEGNPLFVEELVASIADGEPRLPQLSSVRAVIRERIARLPEPTRAFVVAAATLGREFRASAVAHMLDGADVALLKPVLVLGIVAMIGPDRYRFSHALIAEAIVDELDPGERARLHLRAAQAIERYDDDPSALAHHLFEAGVTAAEAAVKAAERAAKIALAQLAFEDAAALLARACEALSLVQTADRRRWRAELLCARAEALQHATQPSLATPLCDEAATIARELGDGELLARIALVRGLEFKFGRTDSRLVDALVEALAAIGEHGPVRLRAKMHARLAAAEQPAADPAGPVARSFAAIELAKDLDARDRLDVMYVAIAALVEYVEPPRIEPLHHEVLALARGVDPWIVVHTRLRLCFVALERADRRTFDARVDAFTHDAHALGLGRWLHHVHMLAAMGAILDGRFDEAEREAEEARKISAAMNDANALWLLDVHHTMRDYVRTRPIPASLRAKLESYAPARLIIRAWLAAHAGELDDARSTLAQIPRLPVDPDLITMTCNAIALVGDPELSAPAYATLLGWRGRVAVAGMVGSVVVDLHDRQLLMLATVIEKWDAIDAHAESALDKARGLGSAVWVAKVNADWADALARRGRPGDEAKAAELRARALADAERFGMPGLAARCRSVAPLARPAPRDDNRVEIVRAGELWTLTGFGEQIHVKDSRGMQMIAKLVEAPGRELHALELAGGDGAVDGGDAGPALDAKARAAYKARLAELVEARDQADAWGDRGRAERANEEIEALAGELERAFGLGGRERKVGAASERARTNAQRRIMHALDQVRAASPRIADHLAATVKTGTYCSYTPVGTAPDRR